MYFVNHPGAHIYVIDDNGSIYCTDCADSVGLKDRGGQTHWEGDPLICEKCGDEILAEYPNE